MALPNLQVFTKPGQLHIFHELVIQEYKPGRYSRGPALEHSNLEGLFFGYWFSLFERPTDTIPFSVEKARDDVRHFFFSGSYADIFDFMEVTLENVESVVAPEALRAAWNGVLERYNVGYRMVERQLVSITSSDEIRSIEDTLSSKLLPVRNHLAAALRLASDRKAPDYANSIKESISAVESLARMVTEKESATLGDLTKELSKAVDLHAAFQGALSKLYGYTSDEHGIRHSATDEIQLSKPEAMFMLVTCSAFVNYVLALVAKAGLTIPRP